MNGRHFDAFWTLKTQVWTGIKPVRAVLLIHMMKKV